MTIDIQYHKLLRDIIGGEDKPDPSRGLMTKHISKANIEWDMADGFPAMTTKKLYTKSIIGELLWFLKGSTNIAELEGQNIKIWRKDAFNYAKRLGYDWSMDEFISKMGQKITANYTVGDIGPSYGKQWRDVNGKDQLFDAVHGLVANPYSRRHRVNAWNTEDLDRVALPWCHTDFDICTYRNADGKAEFDLVWSQRSVDTFLGLPFNIASYALLGEIISLMTGLPFRKLYGELKNVHIYENHMDAVESQLGNDPTAYKCPRLEISQYMSDLLKGFCFSPTIETFNGIIEGLRIDGFNISGASYPPIKADMVSPII